jgi:hypothetical protein
MVHLAAQPSRAFLSVSQRRKLHQADNGKAISPSSPGAAIGSNISPVMDFTACPPGDLNPHTLASYGF